MIELRGLLKANAFYSGLKRCEERNPIIYDDVGDIIEGYLASRQFHLSLRVF